MEEAARLDECPSGEQVILEAVDDPQLSIQLYCMGCLPGERITIERIAPFGDPMILSIDNSFISLRKADAAKIKVKRFQAC